MDLSYCEKHNIPLELLKEPIKLSLVDGNEHSSGKLKYQTEPIQVRIGKTYQEPLTFLVTDLAPSTPVILGHSWVKSSQAGCYGNSVRLPNETIANSSKNRISREENLQVQFAELKPFSSSPVQEEDQEDHFRKPTSAQKNEALPSCYQEYHQVFSAKEADVLPPHTQFDCKLTLINPDLPMPPKKIYKLSPNENQELKKYLDEMLAKGFIETSDAPIGAGIFFVPKSDGGLRPCVDYSLLNENLKMNAYPLPLIDELIDSASGATYYTKLDLMAAYNRVRIAEGDEWLTTFTSIYGSFKYLVMPFGLSLAPAVFSMFVAHVLRPYLHIFVVVYIDDILVYTTGTKEEHQNQVKLVLQKLQEFQLYVKLSKCRFTVKEIDFLGYVITSKGLTTDENKIAPIRNWKRPTDVKEVQRFLGLTNYYRRFIPGYSSVSKPMTDLTKKGQPFQWNLDQEEAFNKLKVAVTTAPLLRYPNTKEPFLMDTDASEFAIGAVLIQEDPKTGLTHPVAYFSKKLNPSQRNYSVYDKELYAIVVALQFWRHYLYGSPHVIKIACDHRNLLYFKKTRILSARHARWTTILNEYRFELTYKKGLDNPAADALSRMDFEGEKSLRKATKTEQILLPENFWTRTETANRMITSQELGITFDEEEDAILHIAHKLATNEWHPDIDEACQDYLEDEVENFAIMGPTNRLVRKLANDQWATYLAKSERENSIMRYHNTMGHLGAAAIEDEIKRRYWWDGNMRRAIEKVLDNCTSCAEARGRVGHPALIRPIHPEPLPFVRWSLDFMGDYPPSSTRQNRYILVALDYATRYIVTQAVKTADGDTVVRFLHEKIVNVFGKPLEILTDRAPSFQHGQAKTYMECQGILPLSTSAYHPRTNGANERTHAMILHAIRTMVAEERTDWDLELAAITFAINCRRHAASGKSPYYLTYGVHPTLPVTNDYPGRNRDLLDEAELRRRNQRYQSRQLEELGLARKAAQEGYLAQMEQMKENDRKKRGMSKEDYQDLLAETHLFEVGDMVKIRRSTRDKFTPLFHGPYYIHKIGSPGLYTLITARGNIIREQINQERLSKWTPGKDTTDRLPEDNTNEEEAS
jgi:hypothetical protein